MMYEEKFFLLVVIVSALCSMYTSCDEACTPAYRSVPGQTLHFHCLMTLIIFLVSLLFICMRGLCQHTRLAGGTTSSKWVTSSISCTTSFSNHLCDAVKEHPCAQGRRTLSVWVVLPTDFATCVYSVDPTLPSFLRP